MHTFLTQKFCFMCFMQFLNLESNQIADAGLTAFAKAVESGALASLKSLNLQLNQIGDAGMSALASACASGALASGATILLQGNSVTQTGKQVMRNAAEARGSSTWRS